MENYRDIFISYRNDVEGEQFAGRLSRELMYDGYSVYYNPDEKRTGDFSKRLNDAIYACKDFVCIITKGYLASLTAEKEISWVREELLYAKEYSRNIMPVLVGEAEMPNEEELPDNLKFFSYIDAFSFPKDFFRKSPYAVFAQALYSKNDGGDIYRDVSCSNPRVHPEKLLEEIIALAESGDVKAMYKAGMMYFHGIAGPRDFRKAAYWLKKVSESSHPCAVYADTLIARMYYSGSMPREEQSYQKSYEYHRRAETTSYSAAQAAFMKKIGSGCAYNYAEAEAYYRKILDRGDSMCRMEFGKFYEANGRFAQAAELYGELADTIPEASYRLGIMYKNGVLASPPEPDYLKAAHYLKIAADQGNTEAAFAYAVLYFNPTGKLKKNFQEAQKYFIIAADKGHMEAQYILGYMYEYGHVQKDYGKAVSYYEKAALQGHVFSAMELAVLYQQPELHNYQKAFQYCLFSAEHGCALANFLLGNMYFLGAGCESDENKAFLYYQRAADAGIMEAKIMMEEAEKVYLNG